MDVSLTCLWKTRVSLHFKLIVRDVPKAIVLKKAKKWWTHLYQADLNLLSDKADFVPIKALIKAKKSKATTYNQHTIVMCVFMPNCTTVSAIKQKLHNVNEEHAETHGWRKPLISLKTRDRSIGQRNWTVTNDEVVLNIYRILHTGNREFLLYTCILYS